MGLKQIKMEKVIKLSKAVFVPLSRGKKRHLRLMRLLSVIFGNIFSHMGKWLI